MITTMISLCLVVGILSSLVTWVVVDYYNRYRVKRVGVCPFKNACMEYSEVETKETLRRVAKLMVKNIEEEERVRERDLELYKQLLK